VETEDRLELTESMLSTSRCVWANGAKESTVTPRCEYTWDVVAKIITAVINYDVTDIVP
jgi:hypothetical protein